MYIKILIAIILFYFIENLRAILLLAHLLPVSNSLRKGKGKKKGVTSKKVNILNILYNLDYDLFINIHNYWKSFIFKFN